MNAPKKKPGRPRSVDRDKTVRLAADLYWRRGTSALSLNEVCRLTEISKPSLYREFGGEDGLMAASLDHYAQEVMQPLWRGLEVDRPFAEMLRAMIVGLSSDRGVPPGCLLTKMRFNTPSLGPLTLERMQVHANAQRDAFEAFFRRAQARGDADPEIDPELAGRHLDTQIALLLMQVSNDLPTEHIRDQTWLALRSLVREA